jgi:hypothetical protein
MPQHQRKTGWAGQRLSLKARRGRFGTLSGSHLSKTLIERKESTISQSLIWASSTSGTQKLCHLRANRNAAAAADLRTVRCTNRCLERHAAPGHP